MTATFVIAVVAGMLLSTLYFGLLWQSTRRLTAKCGYRAFALAAFARLGLVLAGLALFFFAGGGLPELAAAAIGFITARVILTRTLSRTNMEG